MSSTDSVRAHYSRVGLAGQIIAALEGQGIDPGTVPLSDIPPVDELHVRGREATAELASLAGPTPGTTVLDVGCGVGGSSRFLASVYGCRVTGMDLTGSYCHAADELSAWFGLSSRTTYVQADATALPVGARRFDVVWTQHAQMNIADKPAFYGELARAVADGGRLLFHDVFAGRSPGLVYPLPWAGTRQISHLADPDEAHALLSEAGLVRVAWRDCTVASTEWMRTVAAAGPLGAPSVRELVMGSDGPAKIRNLADNLAAGRLRIIQARYDRPAPGTATR